MLAEDFRGRTGRGALRVGTFVSSVPVLEPCHSNLVQKFSAAVDFAIEPPGAFTAKLKFEAENEDGDLSNVKLPALLQIYKKRRASTATRRLQRALQKLILRRKKHMCVGTCILHLKSGEQCSIGGAKIFPLASVAKLPILIAAVLQLQGSKQAGFAEPLKLNTTLSIDDADKCIGSGQIWKQSKKVVSLGECLDLMITISDNTAADLVLKTVTLAKVRQLMEDLQLRSINLCLSQRQAFLIALGKAPQLAGLSSRQIMNKWKEWTDGERIAVATMTEAVNRGLNIDAFTALEKNSYRLHKVQGNRSWEDDMALAITIDNTGSPADICCLLAKLAKGEILSPAYTQYCFSVLQRQKCGACRLPCYLPEGTYVYHKTGTILGVVNDAGIIEVCNPQNKVIIASFVDQIQRYHEREAEAVIARIGQLSYKAYHEKV